VGVGVGVGEEDEEDGMVLDEEREDVRKAALEFMISLSEAKPSMVRKVEGWTGAIVRGCLEGMGELRDDNLDVWLESDVRFLSSFPFPSLPSITTNPLLPLFSRQKTQQMTHTHTSTNNPWID
jgi:hypothetical protein